MGVPVGVELLDTDALAEGLDEIWIPGGNDLVGVTAVEALGAAVPDEEPKEIPDNWVSRSSGLALLPPALLPDDVTTDTPGNFFRAYF